MAVIFFRFRIREYADLNRRFFFGFVVVVFGIQVRSQLGYTMHAQSERKTNAVTMHILCSVTKIGRMLGSVTTLTRQLGKGEVRRKSEMREANKLKGTRVAQQRHRTSI